MAGQTILVVPTQAILEQQATHNDADTHYQHAKTAHADSKLILTTPDSLPHVLKLIDASRFNLVIDEAHNIAVAGYRKRAYDNVVRCLGGQWQRVILMTGTPLPLVTANLALFTNVSVNSPVRIQNATHMIYKHTDIVNNKKVTKGDLIASIINDLPDSGHSLIFLNDKKHRLDRLLFELRAVGYTDDQIALINADQKQSPAYRSLVERERVPDQVQIVIATSVISEGFNIRDEFATVHLSHVSSIEAQQIVNRFRSGAVEMVYWYSTGKGEATHFDLEKVASELLQDAIEISAKLNANQDADPNDATNDKYRTSRLLAAATFEGTRMVELAEDELTGVKRWQVSAVGVNHVAYQRLKSAEITHPNLFKANTARYGWVWCETQKEQLEPKNKPGRDAYAAHQEEERLISLCSLLDLMRKEGLESVKRNIKHFSQSSQYVQVARIALSLYTTLGCFDKALEATRWSRGNPRRVYTIQRRIEIARSDNSLIAGLFEVGEKVTSQVILDRLREAIANDPILRTLQNPDKLTAQKAVLVIKDYITIKRGKESDKSNCYIVTSLNASMAKCPTITNTDEVMYKTLSISHLFA